MQEIENKLKALYDDMGEQLYSGLKRAGKLFTKYPCTTWTALAFVMLVLAVIAKVIDG